MVFSYQNRGHVWVLGSFPALPSTPNLSRCFFSFLQAPKAGRRDGQIYLSQLPFSVTAEVLRGRKGRG